MGLARARADNDGYLDVLMGNIRYYVGAFQGGAFNELHHNNGDGTFTAVFSPMTRMPGDVDYRASDGSIGPAYVDTFAVAWAD